MALDWDKLRIFHAAAEAGSFTHAADVLNLSQSAISRQVAALEQEVGTPYPLPLALTVGDEVLIEGTGAYTTTYASVAFNGFEPLQSYVI